MYIECNGVTQVLDIPLSSTIRNELSLIKVLSKMHTFIT